MVRSKWITSMLVCGFACVLPMSAYAGSNRIDQIIDSIEIAEEYNEVENFSENSLYSDVSFHRGEVISFIQAGLEDYGFGVAHVSGEVACHHPVEGIHIRLMLQRWNEDYQQWENVNRQDFEWNAEDLPEGEELTYASIDYNIPGCESGKVYRTRGIFGAWDDEYDDTWQGFSSGLEF